MNDVFFISKSPKTILDSFWGVMRLVYETGATHKLKKYECFAVTIEYLCHITRAERQKLAEHTTDALAKLDCPTAQTDMRSFFGTVKWF